VQWFIAGWSSPVARQAHNLKVIGSNPIPATRHQALENMTFSGVFCCREFDRPSIVTAAFVPIAALAIWWTVRRIRKKHITGED
jgi:hypothetical protein